MLMLFALPPRVRDALLLAAALLALGMLSARAQQPQPGIPLAEQIAACEALPLCQQLFDEDARAQRLAATLRQDGADLARQWGEYIARTHADAGGDL